MNQSFFQAKQNRERIVSAIEKAELNTSGEIRVHIEAKWKGDPIERAVTIFNKLKLYKTVQRNGVLIYLAYDSSKFAIIGDSGINQLVPENFWDEIKVKMGASFARGEFIEGICEAVVTVGVSLKTYFPYHDDDKNELSNEISFGE